ncbi:MAG: serine protease, partial [Sphaerospermopsis kisseleviana]
MKLSVKQLAVYLSLVAMGSSLGILGSRFFPSNGSFQELKNVTAALPSESVITYPSQGLPNSAGGDNVNFIATAVQR